MATATVSAERRPGVPSGGNHLGLGNLRTSRPYATRRPRTTEVAELVVGRRVSHRLSQGVHQLSLGGGSSQPLGRLVRATGQTIGVCGCRERIAAIDHDRRGTHEPKLLGLLQPAEARRAGPARGLRLARPVKGGHARRADWGIPRHTKAPISHWPHSPLQAGPSNHSSQSRLLWITSASELLNRQHRSRKLLIRQVNCRRAEDRRAEPGERPDRCRVAEGRLGRTRALER